MTTYYRIHEFQKKKIRKGERVSYMYVCMYGRKEGRKFPFIRSFILMNNEQLLIIS